MRPRAQVQIRWGLGAAGAALLVLLVLALVPDPLFRQKVFTTSFDDVSMITPGVPAYFQGAEFGAVRSVSYEPATQSFRVRIAIERDWKPGVCGFARIHEVNPLAAPRIELTSANAAAGSCAAAWATQDCLPLAAPAQKDPAPLTGCRRAAGLFQTAAITLAEASHVAKIAEDLALQLQGMAKGGKGGPHVDVAKISQDLTTTLASVSAMTGKVDASLTPGRGDLARTLENVRLATAPANIDRLTQTVDEARSAVQTMNALVKDNQASVKTLLEQGAAASQDSRALLENLQASLVSTSNNLDRATQDLDILTERVSSDPTYVLHGQKVADPPNPTPGSRP